MAAPPPKESRRIRPQATHRAESHNPRRKFRRRTTDSLSDSREFLSDDDSYSSMAESLELDPIGSDGEEVDEETGLTGKERQKYLQRKRRQDALDARIAGASGLSLDERKAADRNVMRRLIVNAMLIAAWYVFSLSISLVRSPASLQSMQLADPNSTTNGCSQETISTSTSPCSPPRCI